MVMPTKGGVSLYRFYDAEDTLLYVGITEAGAMRWNQHRKSKHWWPEVVSSTVEHFTTRAEALEAERQAIIAEQPLHNVVHNRTRQPDRSEELVWKCVECGQPIPDGGGYIEVDVNAAIETIEARGRREAELRSRRPDGLLVMSGGDLLGWPDDESWHAIHRACDTDPVSSPYWFDVDRARTLLQVLDWTLHLSEKSWLDGTNWSAFVYRAVTGLRGAA